MGVYISGMEMPKSRGEYDLRLYVDSDGTAVEYGPGVVVQRTASKEERS